MSYRMRYCLHLAAGGLVLWLALNARGAGAAFGMVKSQMRIAVSSNVVRGVNGNDARAAMKGWADALSRQAGDKVEYSTALLEPQDLIQAIRKHQVDAAAMTVVEYAQAKAFTDPAQVVVDVDFTREAERYVILVRADSAIRSLGDLKGRSLVIHLHPLTSLADAWLDVLLDSEHLPALEQLAGRLTRQEKLSRGVVLPVFFRQVDACLVTRRGFEAMIELNPQLGKQLQVLATSPKFVPSLFVYHTNCSPVGKALLSRLLQGLATSETGKQVQTLFQVNQYAVVGSAAIQPSLDLLTKAARLKARTGGAK